MAPRVNIPREAVQSPGNINDTKPGLLPTYGSFFSPLSFPFPKYHSPIVNCGAHALRSNAAFQQHPQICFPSPHTTIYR